MDKIRLNNNMEMPVIGFGCYNAKGGDNEAIIMNAIESGYTFFDTASLYGTERALGNVLKSKQIKRENFFIQSKLWTDEMGYDNAKYAIERTLNRLQLDYVDVYLIHWPIPSIDTTVDEWKLLQRETYKAMEEMIEEGTIKAIGLSNFLPHHLDNILNICNIAPVVDQLEYHIGYTQENAKSYAQEKGLVVQAWSPLGRGSVLEDKNLINMASKYNVSVSQLALRFVYQSGVVALPKATSPDRQRQNIEIFNFELSKDDFNFIACLPNNLWSGEHPDIAIPNVKSNFNQ